MSKPCLIKHTNIILHCIYSVKTGNFFPFQNDPKNLDAAFKTDLFRTVMKDETPFNRCVSQ